MCRVWIGVRGGIIVGQVEAMLDCCRGPELCVKPYFTCICPLMLSPAVITRGTVLHKLSVSSREQNLVAGGITWESLELEQGPGTMVGQIEAVAPASQQILVQQTPSSSSSTSLQDVLQLPGYPSSDGGHQSLLTAPLSRLDMSELKRSLLPIMV